jgi:hypothetical protein
VDDELAGELPGPDDRRDDEPAESAESAESFEQDASDEAFERPVDRFRRGAVGSVVAAGLLGLADALEGRKKEEAAIVQEAPTPPVREPRRLELFLDPDDPSKSLVFLPEPAPEPARETAPEPTADDGD